MFNFDNPFDISKDGGNTFVDGIRFYIRESEELKRKIINYLEKNSFEYFYLYSMTPLEILIDVMKILQIKDKSLTIGDEHELLDWIFANKKI